MMIPITFVWVFWPLGIPVYMGTYSLLLPCVGVTMYLLKRAWRIIESSWKSDEELQAQLAPKFVASSITLESPGTLHVTLARVYNDQVVESTDSINFMFSFYKLL